MTSSESDRERVWKLLAGLKPAVLHAQIDEPALRVVSEFDWPVPLRPTSWEFMQLLASVVSRLQENASLRLSSEEAYAQGIAFLDRHYPHGKERGSEAALLEFLQDAPWAVDKLKRAVLLGFVETQKQQFIKAQVFACLHAGWPIRCALAATLIELFHAHLSEAITSASPQSFVDSLEDLLIVCAEGERPDNGCFRAGWETVFAGAS